MQVARFLKILAAALLVVMLAAVDSPAQQKKAAAKPQAAAQLSAKPAGAGLPGLPGTIPAAVAEDWRLQDGLDKGKSYKDALAAIVAELGEAGKDWKSQADALAVAGAADPRWVGLYYRASEARRAHRLELLRQKFPQIVFTKHFNLGGSHYAYTEAQSDGQGEKHFIPGSALCLLTLDGPYGQVRTLLEDANGVIRDPDVSYDGKRILFSWKKSLQQDDFHLYEMDGPGGALRPITSGLGVADYEGAYLASGEIVFNSTRPVQIVDCFWPEVSNIYICSADGRCLRRLTFDQVHDNYPAVMPDGRITYTRWEYNDRGQIYVQSLFQMNGDGTGQTEFYGNNSWFPTSILHARGIPGTGKVVAIASGHHTAQVGKLILIDPAKGRQENQGVQLVAPVRETKAVHVDRYGQEGELFQYPYPVSESQFLVTYSPNGWEHKNARGRGVVESGHFGIYWMDVDGRRELLAWDEKISCNQSVPLAVRPAPHPRYSPVDYRKDEGVFYMQDIYRGPGLAGVPRGTIKKLRVVALDYRPVSVGSNGNRGPAGGAMSSTPPAIGNGSWDPKIVLGEVAVHEDGSAMFAVPARTPVYFQALNEKGQMVQTMRSWSTLQPGEKFSCVGCHESKNESAPAPARPPLALQQPPQPMNGFYGPPRGFSFPREIQPILDKHCIRCHNAANIAGARKEGDRAARPPFSLEGTGVPDPQAKRTWSTSYLSLTSSMPKNKSVKQAGFAGQQNELVNWTNVQSAPPMLPPYDAGAAKSRLLTMLEKGHSGVKLSAEQLAKISCWIDLAVPFCGDYFEANLWSPAEIEKYNRFVAKRKTLAGTERRGIEEFLAQREQNEAHASRL